MNIQYKESHAAMVRFIELADDNANVLTANITALLAKLKLKSAEIDNLGINQADGTSTSRSGARQRRDAAKALRQSLVDIAEMARLLDKTTHPGLAAQVPAIHHGSYRALQDRAGATVKALTPMKAVFIANGFAPTFLDDLTALAAQLSTATIKKYHGLSEQVQSTATLRFAVRGGVTLMRSIHTALKPILRNSDPGLLASFKAAAHIRSSNSSKKAPVTTPPAMPGGPGTTPPATLPRPAVTTNVVAKA